jgi:hypothetical protein
MVAEYVLAAVLTALIDQLILRLTSAAARAELASGVILYAARPTVSTSPGKFSPAVKAALFFDLYGSSKVIAFNRAICAIAILGDVYFSTDSTGL